MARPLRLHVPGGFYHVTLRGNHQNAIFYQHADRDLLDDIVAESLTRLAARVHAYCWMTNHIHLLVQVSDVPLGRLIRRIASNYAQTVQRRLATTGHLFERRYHAHLVDEDRYLLTLIQYIHLNPVRAGLVSDPSAYPWSSHRVYLRLKQQPWVTTEFTMHMLASHPDHALSNYRRLMNDPEPPSWGNGALVPHRDQPQVLGDDVFVARVATKPGRPITSPTLQQLLEECASRFQISADSLTSPARTRRHAAARAWLAHQVVDHGVLTVCGLARVLGRSEGAIRQAMLRYPARPKLAPNDGGG